jgi:alkylated DNA repair dioxygenase AlkB
MTNRPQGRTSWAALRARAAGRPDRPRPERGLSYDPTFLTADDRAEIVAWLSSIHPIWENRFSPHHPPPPGQTQRSLLRPVYWLGNWQFACLGYYHPPRGLHDRCVAAEPFPPVLARLAKECERRTRDLLPTADVPSGWKLNTCLVNFYGDRFEDGRRIDTARVGEHKDFEPGPVASISLGERALFQFVSSRRPGERDDVVIQQWLEDGSLQLFGGARFKDALFHRVQRVDRRGGFRFPLHEERFETRRVNLTFRFVPEVHVVPFRRLPPDDRDDVRGYVATLARHSPWFAKALSAE